MTYRYIYKITCTEGDFKDKFYFGQRTTRKLPSEDKYKGSGVLIQKYYKKYPNAYNKEIISFHKTKDELNQAEYDIIHSWLNHPDCLNLKEGGEGGSYKGINKGKPSVMLGKHHSEKSKEKMKIAATGRKYQPRSEESRNHMSEIMKGKNVGKIRSEESKRKNSEAHKGIIPKNKGKHKVYNEPNDKSKGFHYE